MIREEGVGKKVLERLLDWRVLLSGWGVEKRVLIESV